MSHGAQAGPSSGETSATTVRSGMCGRHGTKGAAPFEQHDPNGWTSVHPRHGRLHRAVRRSCGGGGRDLKGARPQCAERDAQIIHGTPHKPPHPIVSPRRRAGDESMGEGGNVWSTEHGLNWRNNPPNLDPNRQNALHACWAEGDPFHEIEIPETSEEQDHNMWNEGLNLITEHSTGLHIQSCLRDEELGRVATSCHFAVDCLCAEAVRQKA